MPLTRKSAKCWRSRQMRLRSHTTRGGAPRASLAAAVALGLVCLFGSGIAPGAVQPDEPYIHVPMPLGFRVVLTQLDGPVFADSGGRTLYTWPRRSLRNGAAGDNKDESECSYIKTTVSAGIMSPYPAGLLVPDLAERPSCAQAWPPVLAAGHAKAVGSWTIFTRKDGKRQWAYRGYALYTSALDQQPGDVLGGSSRRSGGDGPVVRKPVGPPADVPPAFSVVSTALGRLLVTKAGFSVYVSDHDKSHHSNCDAVCTQTWTPIVAADLARPHGKWSIIRRATGTRQWAFRGKPLYLYANDQHVRSLRGSDVSGWHNVYTQPAPPFPKGFTVQNTTAGQVLADSHGMTIYVYRCGDDTLDQLGCDYPSETQAYRLAMCGGGEALRCVRSFPYVLAPKKVHGGSRAAWSAIDIDPMTGRFAQPGQRGALHVWAYRGRPVYTYAGDQRPGDINADGHGEFRGQRDGYLAFWLRDDYYGQDD
jgi:predicted lipoprotein with Yx(FWY)xxD motif